MIFQRSPELDAAQRLIAATTTLHSHRLKHHVDMLGLERGGKTALFLAILRYVLDLRNPGHLLLPDHTSEQMLRIIHHRECKPTQFAQDGDNGTSHTDNGQQASNDAASVLSAAADNVSKARTAGPEWAQIQLGDHRVQLNALPGEVLREVNSEALSWLYRSNPHRMCVATLHALRSHATVNYYAMLDSIHLLQRTSELNFPQAFQRAFQAINHFDLNRLDLFNVDGRHTLEKAIDGRLVPREGWTGKEAEPYELMGVSADEADRHLKTLRRIAETVVDDERYRLTPLRLAAQSRPDQFVVYQSHHDLVMLLPSVRARGDLIDETFRWFFGAINIRQNQVIKDASLKVKVNPSGVPIYVERAAQSGAERVLDAIKLNLAQGETHRRWWSLNSSSTTQTWS
ncbi:hypothetical protein [Planctopirus hydrillae]|uniref:Uncharacterized protein n=1 Tax=Planctopirus hydrillae TaxID=1841610 RepID=A0A1C3EIV3_9PLAN|nr:hypothetical protein [Planctopirus hydrillae]ODA33149.1 hypothetical protein A6X21_05125 [Planctopirus hydrillae]